VDSILIDEARTPLIISGPAVMGQDSAEYMKYKPAIEGLVRTQERLCNRYLSEAESLIRKLRPEDGNAPSSPSPSRRRSACCSTRSNWASPAPKGSCGSWRTRTTSAS